MYFEARDDSLTLYTISHSACRHFSKTAELLLRRSIVNDGPVSGVGYRFRPPIRLCAFLLAPEIELSADAFKYIGWPKNWHNFCTP